MQRQPGLVYGAIRFVEAHGWPALEIEVEAIPWAQGKHQLTTTHARFGARWAKRLNGTAVAQSFHTTWTHVYRSIGRAVAWGPRHVLDRSHIMAHLNKALDGVQAHEAHTRQARGLAPC